MDSLKESEESLRRAQQIAHLGSWDLELVNNRLSWSDEVYRIFGLQPQEFAATYEAFLDAVHPEDRAAVDGAYEGSVRQGRTSYEITHRVIRRNTGEVRWVHEKCEHLRDAEGRVVRSLGMVQDITERKRAEEELRISRNWRASDSWPAALRTILIICWSGSSATPAWPRICSRTGAPQLKSSDASSKRVNRPRILRGRCSPTPARAGLFSNR